MDAHFYNVDLSWSTDRKGILTSSELDQEIVVATPPQFPKGIPNVWSPEHLFTASVSSCFMTTFLSIAENSRLEFEAFNCMAKGKLEQIEGKFKMSEIILEATLILKNMEDKEKGERILNKSEAACLISNSINSKVTLISHIK